MMMATTEWWMQIPQFKDIGACQKCGMWKLACKYVPAILSSDPPEHLMWTCETCGAQRASKCKDASP